jgi:hypothetical protein
MKDFIKVYTLSLLLLSMVFIAYGQKTHLDSICIHIDDQMELKLSVYDYKNLSESLENDLKSLQSILRSKNDLPDKGSFLVTYEPDKLLSIKRGEPEERIIWENGKQIHYQFKSQCNIFSGKYHLQIHFSNPEMLLSESLQKRIKEVVDSTTVMRGRFSAVHNFVYNGTELTHTHKYDKESGQMDAMMLKGGVGANILKNQPVMDLSAELGFVFSKNGIWKNQYSLSYSQLSDFTDPLKINLNGFAGIGYRHNMSNKLRSPNWLGIELGYLVQRQGELLDKNTFRIGFNWELGKSVSVSPQLYLSGKSTFPALRIGFGF